MTVHQCARFSASPMQSHELAVMRIGCYLLGFQDKSLVYTVNAMRGLETYVDSNFAGGWDPKNVDDASTLYSQTGFVIKYVGYPVYWQSKLQTEIALAMAEAEYIVVSQAPRETLPIMSLTKKSTWFSLSIFLNQSLLSKSTRITSHTLP